MSYNALRDLFFVDDATFMEMLLVCERTRPLARYWVVVTKALMIYNNIKNEVRKTITPHSIQQCSSWC